MTLVLGKIQWKFLTFKEQGH